MQLRHHRPEQDSASVGLRPPFTTLSGLMIAAEIDARQIGRFLELRPDERSQTEATRAFRLATVIRHVRGESFR